MKKPKKVIKKKVLYLLGTKAESLTHRTRMLLKFDAFFDRIHLVSQSGSANDSQHITIPSYPNPFGVLRVMKLSSLKQFLEPYVYFPSPHILFVKPAIKHLTERLRKDLAKGNTIYLLTSLPPHDLALIGLELKRRLPDIRWIVDWRDLWSYDEFYLSRIKKIYKKRLLIYERQIMCTCDINITTNLKAKNVLESHYKIPPHKVIAIHHCFDREDFSGIQTYEPRTIEKKGDKALIGFLGTLFKPPKVEGRKICDLFSALAADGVPLTLNIYGDKSKAMQNYSKRRFQTGAIKLFPRTSHRQSLKTINDCDILLIALSNLSNCKIIMHSKLPHYLLLNKPILALVPDDSFVADTIRKTQTGVVIAVNKKECKKELKKFLNDYLSGTYQMKKNNAEIGKYSWENTAVLWQNAFRHL